MKQKLIAVVGPTASGKTDFAIDLALSVGGEVVSADSMMIYRHMDIGTAKPTLEERRGVPHHMIDILDPRDDFSVAAYVTAAKSCIDAIAVRGNVPILAGGTGLYIDNIITNTNFADALKDEEYRAKMADFAAQHGNGALHQKLQEVDAAAAARLHPNDTRRVIRALEVFFVSKKTLTQHEAESRLLPSPYDAQIIGLEVSRKMLYNRIDKRVDVMFEHGLVGEVESLLNMGVDRGMTAMQGIGYKEVAAYIYGEMSKDAAIDTIKQSTRRYAKRQCTWFRRNKAIEWKLC